MHYATLQIVASLALFGTTVSAGMVDALPIEFEVREASNLNAVLGQKRSADPNFLKPIVNGVERIVPEIFEGFGNHQQQQQQQNGKREAKGEKITPKFADFADIVANVADGVNSVESMFQIRDATDNEWTTITARGLEAHSAGRSNVKAADFPRSTSDVASGAAPVTIMHQARDNDNEWTGIILRDLESRNGGKNTDTAGNFASIFSGVANGANAVQGTFQARDLKTHDGKDTQKAASLSSLLQSRDVESREASPPADEWTGKQQ